MKTKPTENFDSNLAGSGPIEEDGLRFYNVRQAPFRIYGLMWESPTDAFRRMPKEVAPTINPGTKLLHSYTAGGRVRFSTNSKTIAVRVDLEANQKSTLLSQPLKCGFDVYVNENGVSRYYESIRPPVEWERNGYTGKITFPDNQQRDITVYFPCYGGVDFLEIGLEADATLSEGGTYRHETPVLFYGSSITQGAASARPGIAFASRISRNLDCNFMNLGFSGNARGEIAMAQYIANQDMCLFVMDYDHNSPNAEHLQQQHEPFFMAIRQENPTLPVLMVTRPPLSYETPGDSDRRYEVIRKTYENAKARGDENVYLLDGRNLFREDLIGFDAWDCTADRVHPNDLGAFLMACAFTKEIAKIMNWPVLNTGNQLLK